MIYLIHHFYCGSDFPTLQEFGAFKHTFTSKVNRGTKKKPNWQEESFEANAVEILDLNDFILKYGPATVKPPTETHPYWFIMVTDKTGKFTQR